MKQRMFESAQDLKVFSHQPLYQFALKQSFKKILNLTLIGSSLAATMNTLGIHGVILLLFLQHHKALKVLRV